MNQIVKTSVTRRQFVVASATAAGGLAISVAFPALADAASHRAAGLGSRQRAERGQRLSRRSSPTAAS